MYRKVVLTLSALLVTVMATLATESTAIAQTVDTQQRVPMVAVSGFNPGYIISDAQFFNSRSMSQADIQSFLATQVPQCSPGYTCLRDWRDNSRTTPADPMCASYRGVAGELASAIIANVAVACGINPQVLLVTLEKEQSLVTSTSPSLTRYQIAMGNNCPDTSACDVTSYGFFNQVYGAARQFKRYANPPGTSNYFTWYAPGKTWNILFNPNTQCGSSPVYIQNQATADLYYYTPYQPNAAALNAGSGRGDGCSSYGNRNFYNIFLRWFGSPTNPADSAIVARYLSVGGPTGYLGADSGNGACGLVDGGCWRGYSRGAIYASASTSAQIVLPGPIQSLWAQLGYEQPTPGSLGYPLIDTVTGLRDGGSFQTFQRGSIYALTTGTFLMRNGPVRDFWVSQNYEYGPLGFPTTSTAALRDSGSYEAFQGGVVYTSPSGTFSIPLGPLYERWAFLGYEQNRAGALGYPTGVYQGGLRNGGAWQSFEYGALYATPRGVFALTDSNIRAAWASSGFERGPLGYPIGDTTTGLAGGGVRQDFEGGTIISSARGVFALTDAPTINAWVAQGAQAGALGYPIAASKQTPTAVWTYFDGGAIVSTSQGVTVVPAALAASVKASGLEGLLGSPAGAAQTTGQRVIQRFSGGVVCQAGSTVAAVGGDYLPAWNQRGGATGVLGCPTGPARAASRGAGWQPFEFGALYRVSGSFVAVSDPVFSRWRAAGYEYGRLGFPTTDAVDGLNGEGGYQAFEGGAVYWSGTTPATSLLNGPIRARWSDLGFEHPVLTSVGYPTSAVAAAGNGGSWQGFQGGAIYAWGNGTVVVRAPIFGAWALTGYEWGALGYPRGDTVVGLRDGGAFQRFDGGVIYSSTGYGAHVISNGAILNAWVAQNYERGRLGYPVSDFRATSTGGVQDFEHGSLVWNAASGAVVSRYW